MSKSRSRTNRGTEIESANTAADALSTTADVDGDGPTVDAGVEQTVDAGETVELQATTAGLDSQTLEYSWTQVTGTPVVLSCATVVAPCFEAPELMSDESLIFEVTANDGTTTITDTVSVIVRAGSSGPAADVEAPDSQDPVELAMAELRASRAETGFIEVVESGGEVLSQKPTHSDMGGAATPGQAGIETPSQTEDRSGRRAASSDGGDARGQDESVDLRDRGLTDGTTGTAEPDEKAEQSSSWMKIWRGALGLFRSGSMTDKRPGI